MSQTMERLQELKKEVAAQELKLKSLQQQQQHHHHHHHHHHQQHDRQPPPSVRGASNNGSVHVERSIEQEAMGALIFLKEKELALALMKVAELTGQLELLKKSEGKSESPPRRMNRSVTSMPSLPGATVPVQNAAEAPRCSAPVFTMAPTSNHLDRAPSPKTAAYFESRPSASERIKQSTSFDVSYVAPRGRSISREEFFSSSAGSSFPPSISWSSASESDPNSTTTILSATKKRSFYPNVNSLLSSPSDSESSASRDLATSPPQQRHSSSSSIMSRFGPKPYSSRSVSVDCSTERRPLQRNFEFRSKDDAFQVATSNPAAGSVFVSKGSNFCLLPKSASFHYGHNRSNAERMPIKIKTSVNKRETDVSQQTPRNSNNSPSTIGSERFYKPKLTPKPVHLLKECKSLLSGQQGVPHSAPSMGLADKEDQQTGVPSFSALLPTDTLLQSYGAYDRDPVQNNLTITLHHQTIRLQSEPGIQLGASDPNGCEKTESGSDPPEIFKKGGVKELSKMFSQLPKDNPALKRDVSSSSLASKTESQVLMGPAKSQVECVMDPGKHLAAQDAHLASTSVAESSLISDKMQGSTEVDISANAVSSALSILLSGISNPSRHAIASRPNRLFGYSSSFARPKFSFVPFDQKTDSNHNECEVKHSQAPPPEFSGGTTIHATTRAPTIYSLFSPPPKMKQLTALTTTAVESSAGSEVITSRNNLSGSSVEARTPTRKNVYLPRLSYIRLSSDIAGGGRGTSLPRMKVKKRVTIDPSFLYLNAAAEGELMVIKSVISQIPDPNLANDNGMTALHGAVCNGHVDVVKFLLDFGCDVNASNGDCWTPLHFAALGNKREILELLLGSGACVFSLTASDNETPVQKCQPKNPRFEESVKVLEEYGSRLGFLNDGIVYSMAAYTAECSNECSLQDGEMVKVLKRGDEVESEWWWAVKLTSDLKAMVGCEGYVPRSILSLHPRRPAMWKAK